MVIRIVENIGRNGGYPGQEEGDLEFCTRRGNNLKKVRRFE